jgi:hypothetical protein
MRNNIVSLIVGTRGTGKTDFVKNLLYQSKIGFKKQLVVDTFDSDVWKNLKTFTAPHQENVSVPVLPPENFSRWLTGLYRMFHSDTDYLMQLIQDHANNCQIVFEDATKYVGSKLSKDMKKFVLDSKQKNLDLIFIFHSLGSVPPDLIRVADTLTLFKTNEGEPSKDKYPFPEIPVMMKKVRESKDRYTNSTIRLN